MRGAPDRNPLTFRLTASDVTETLLLPAEAGRDVIERIGSTTGSGGVMRPWSGVRTPDVSAGGAIPSRTRGGRAPSWAVLNFMNRSCQAVIARTSLQACPHPSPDRAKPVETPRVTSRRGAAGACGRKSSSSSACDRDVIAASLPFVVARSSSATSDGGGRRPSARGKGAHDTTATPSPERRTAGPQRLRRRGGTARGACPRVGPDPPPQASRARWRGRAGGGRSPRDGGDRDKAPAAGPLDADGSDRGVTATTIKRGSSSCRSATWEIGFAGGARREEQRAA